MNRSVDFTELGGLYVYQDTLEFLQVAYTQAIDAIVSMFGEKVIVTGLVKDGSTISDGWVILNSQLLPVVGGTIQPYLFLETLVTQEQFADLVQRDVYTVKRLKFTSVSDSNFLFSDFSRLPFATTGLKDALQTIQNLFSKLLFDEPVIISGCATSALNTIDSKVTIATGLAWIDGKMITVPSYVNNTYPVYLKPDATYTTSLPVGSYILFDHETSQRYAHVIKRNTASTGETVMHTNAGELQYFDVSTGLGKWKWKGWKLCDLLKSRSPIGYDNRTSQPAGVDNEAWDATYNTIGTRVGKKKHQLSISELPAHSHSVPATDDTPSGITGGPTYPPGADSNVSTSSVGGDQSHETRHPSAVVLIIEKI
jgi:hypothetical protein